MRYDIYVNGVIAYSHLTENDCDHFCEILSRWYAPDEIKVVER